jgi:hypothetical protein
VSQVVPPLFISSRASLFVVLVLFVAIDNNGDTGKKEMHVPKRGMAYGAERRVIQKAKGLASRLKKMMDFAAVFELVVFLI